MTPNNDHFTGLIKLLLPSELFDYFDIVTIESTESQVHVYLDEQNVIPANHSNEKLSSNGFHNPVIIQDFPLRDKAMYLHIRRRRWIVESTNKAVSRDWKSVANGTRMTEGFATFLKELSGLLPNK